MKNYYITGSLLMMFQVCWSLIELRAAASLCTADHSHSLIKMNLSSLTRHTSYLCSLFIQLVRDFLPALHLVHFIDLAVVGFDLSSNCCCELSSCFLYGGQLQVKQRDFEKKSYFNSGNRT